MAAPVSVTYSSNAPEIASVSSTGFVRGIAAGIAIISARAVAGSSSYTASGTIAVRPATVFDRLVLAAQSRGWQPNPGHVAAGGTVEWQPGTIAVSGVPVRKVWLLNDNYSVSDSIDLSRGPATHTFNWPGTYRYCSNACWDPPEFGIIVVH